MSEKRHRAPATARRVPFLIVNAARSVILQPYALAHAFAHLSLGPGDVVDQRTEWARTNPREAAANDFAEEFLTPARAVSRWYDPREEQTPATDTLLKLGKAFGISVWAALCRSRAIGRARSKAFAALRASELAAFVCETIAVLVKKRPASPDPAPTGVPRVADANARTDAPRAAGGGTATDAARTAHEQAATDAPRTAAEGAATDAPRGADTAAAPEGRRAVLLFLVLGALSGIAPFSIDTYLPALPSISRELSASASTVQLTITACLLGIAVGQLVIGPLSDRWGRRQPLIAGMTAFALSSLLCALAPSMWLLIAARAGQGLSGAAGIVLANAIVGDLHRGRGAARYFSRLWLIGGLAPIVAPLVGGAILQFATWRVVFGLLAAGGAALTLAATLGVPETHPRERRSRGSLMLTLRLLGSLLSHRLFMGYVLTGALMFAAMFSYLSDSSFVYQDVLGLTPAAFALVFGANSAGQLVLSQVNGRLLRSHSPRQLLGVALAICLAASVALALLVTAGATSFLPVTVLLFAFVATLGMVNPNVPALALTLEPGHAGSAAALLGVTQFACGAAIAPLAGIGGNGTAAPMALLIAVLSGAGVLVFLTLTRGAAPFDAE